MQEETTGHGYYVTIPMIIVLDDRLKPNSKLLFGVIANLSSQYGYCFASNKYLSEMLGYSVTSVSDFINELIQCGYLNRTDEVVKYGTQRKLSLNLTYSGKVFEKRPPLQEKQRPSSNKVNDPLQENLKHNKLIYKTNIKNKEPSLEIFTDEEKKTATNAAEIIIQHYNETKKRFGLKGSIRVTKSRGKIISARIKESKADLALIKEMIVHRCKKWKGSKMEEHFVIETLFKEDKFFKYIEETESQPDKDWIEKSQSRETESTEQEIFGGDAIPRGFTW